jgi:hypothetical protein
MMLFEKTVIHLQTASQKLFSTNQYHHGLIGWQISPNSSIKSMISLE